MERPRCGQSANSATDNRDLLCSHPALYAEGSSAASVNRCALAAQRCHPAEGHLARGTVREFRIVDPRGERCTLADCGSPAQDHGIAHRLQLPLTRDAGARTASDGEVDPGVHLQLRSRIWRRWSGRAAVAPRPPRCLSAAPGTARLAFVVPGAGQVQLQRQKYSAARCEAEGRNCTDRSIRNLAWKARKPA